MFPYFFTIVLFVAIAIKYLDFYISSLSGNPGEEGANKTFLFVGIMSSQNHFKQRQTIRETWKWLAINKTIELKFLVGEDVCPIPIKDRSTAYSCDLWLINQPSGSNEFSTLSRPMNVNNCDKGFTFIIKTPILVHKLGVDKGIFNGNGSDMARVVLFNSRTGRKIASATFIKDSFLDFEWKPIQPLKLNEGFEGELKLIGEILEFPTLCRRSLQYVAPVYIFETLLINGKYLPFRLGEWRNILIGMNYSLNEYQSLGDILLARVERYEKYSSKRIYLKQKLKDELNVHGDILFLKGFHDVYDNLSYKLFSFLEWLKTEDRWQYVLKTDDDVFVDLRAVEEGLLKSEDEWDLWSCFRTQSPNPSGKWRDRVSEQYPMFPSGSGYILSREAVRKLIISPRTALGEDVALGMAAQGLKIRRVNSFCSWACGARRSSPPLCNVPEVSREDMMELWKVYQQIGRIP